jgi:K+-transporting ATPase ATPase C chain
MNSTVRPAFFLLALFSVLLCIVYPLVVTGLSQALFPFQANGSVIDKQGKALGSTLIGQPFSSAGYFWTRPSATVPVAYNGSASTGSNLGPANPALREAVAIRIKALRAADPGNAAPIPVDLVTASASGLDPDISPAAALYQIGRVSGVRALPKTQLRRLVERNTEQRSLGILGEPRVNVLRLNLALDELAKKAAEL